VIIITLLIIKIFANYVLQDVNNAIILIIILVLYVKMDII
jgi:hypothetical protein